MKISIHANSNMRDIIEHTKSISLGVQADTETILWDNPGEIPEEWLEKGQINNSIAVQKLVSNPELYKMFKENFGLINGKAAFHLYGFLSPTGLGPMIEMASKHHFMVGEVGRELGFVQNAAIVCGTDVYDALPQLRSLENALVELKYRGEIGIACTHDFQICEILFGHQVAGFSLLCELGQQHPQQLFEFAAGGASSYSLHTDRISVNTLLSYPPYPYSIDNAFSILAPTASEKHMYRFRVGKCELAYSCTWGENLAEAKRRCTRTIQNCRNYYHLLQYRVDYGWKDKFHLNADRYVGFGGINITS